MSCVYVWQSDPTHTEGHPSIMSIHFFRSSFNLCHAPPVSFSFHRKLIICLMEVHYEIRVRNSYHKTAGEAGWEFLFLGANIDAVGEAEKLGISRDRAVTYENDIEGVSLNYEVVG